MPTMQQTIEREPKTPMEILTEEIHKLRKEQEGMYGRIDADRIEVDNRIELLRHVLRRIRNEVR